MSTKPVLPVLYIRDEESFKNVLIRLQFIDENTETGPDCEYGDYVFSCRLIKTLGCKCFEDLRNHFNHFELDIQKHDKINEINTVGNKWEA